MGGPVIGFCGGRIDWSNGDQALPLGPSVVQQTLMPCGPEQCPIGELCPGYVNFPFLPSFLPSTTATATTTASSSSSSLSHAPIYLPISLLSYTNTITKGVKHH
jgi:hypothetical protein